MKENSNKTYLPKNILIDGDKYFDKWIYVWLPKVGYLSLDRIGWNGETKQNKYIVLLGVSWYYKVLGNTLFMIVILETHFLQILAKGLILRPWYLAVVSIIPHQHFPLLLT